MHPISLVNDADFDDSADVDGEIHSQSKHHRGRRSMKQDLSDGTLSSKTVSVKSTIMKPSHSLDTLQPGVR